MRQYIVSLPEELAAVVEELSVGTDAETPDVIASSFAVMGLHMWLQTHGLAVEADIAYRYLMSEAARFGHSPVLVEVVPQGGKR